MVEWKVELLGERHVLDVLTWNFDSGPCIVSFDENQNRHFLTLSSFEQATDANEVLLAGKAAAVSLAGAFFLAGQTLTEPLRVGAVHCVDESGHKQVHVTCSSSIRMSATAHAVVADAEGNVITLPPEQRRLVRLRSLITESENVAKVSRLVQERDFETWVGLYRVFEVIFHDVGGSRGLRDWVSERSIARFKRSANHPVAAGDAARHGHSEEEPPSLPMSLPEAQAWVFGLIHCWVERRIT